MASNASSRRDADDGAPPSFGAPRRTWDIASGLLLAGMAVLILATFRDYGMGWDEPDHRGYGERILRHYKGLWIDQPDSRVFTKGNLYLYGGAFDTFVQLFERVSPLEPYDSRWRIPAPRFTHFAKTFALFAERPWRTMRWPVMIASCDTWPY